MSSTTKRVSPAKLAKSFRVPSSTTDTAIKKYLTALDCPRALTVWLLYSSKSKEDHDQLARLSINPVDYLGMKEFRDAYAATKFLSKANFLDTSFDKKTVAIEKFSQMEEQCRATNTRFRNLGFAPEFTGANVWLLNATTQKISRILGAFRPEELFDQADWGPGVTTLLKGQHVSAINKFHLENGITHELYSLVGDLFPIAYPLWHQHLIHHFGEKCWRFEAGNRVITVPKDSKTDRVIAVEPGINLWFQKGCGAMIRRRLRYRALVDLNNQSWNQLYAKYASRDDVLATCDFSSASDSISLELIRELLPRDWFNVLNACRSRRGSMPGGSTFEWEKFSSMGNGFTFELESLIFYAAACAVCEYAGVGQEVSVYGDDVILPSECMDLFTSFSSFLGFTVNRAKSFSSTYFRESCGSHYYDGTDVKPIFLKERVRNIQAVYKLANGIRMLAHRRNSHYGCDVGFRSVHAYLVRGLPEGLCLRVPASLGDTGIISNFDEAVVPRARHQLEGYRVRCLTATGQTSYFDGQAVLLARLWHPSVEEYGNLYTLRGRVRLRVISSLVSRWYNLGPWI